VQGTPFLELSYDDFAHPIEGYLRTNFITAQAVARHMTRRGRGVLLTISTPGSRMSGVGFLGYGVTCAAVEGLSRILAGELGRHGVRVICLRPDAIPDALGTSHTRAVFEGVAARAGTSVEAMLAARASTGTLLGRFPRLDEVAEFAAFVASDGAGAMTGAIANLSCGSLVD
jgi:NAD(P)-dependent dehydrogenase (short-subunit alcohol dehydrogenase family)